MYKYYIEYISITILFILIYLYQFNDKTIYPKLVFNMWNESVVRYTMFMLLYILSLYNKRISLLFLYVLILVHFEFIPFIKISNK